MLFFPDIGIGERKRRENEGRGGGSRLVLLCAEVSLRRTSARYRAAKKAVVENVLASLGASARSDGAETPDM